MATPVVLALLATAPILLLGLSVALVRDPGPLRPMRVEASEQESTFASLSRSLGKSTARLLVNGRLGPRYRAVVGRWLAEAGQTSSTSVERFTETYAGIVILGVVAVAWFGLLEQLTTGFMVLAATLLLSPLRLRREGKARQVQIERDLPWFLELMAVLLSSGLTFRHALARVTSHSPGPLSDEMAHLLVQLEFGYTPKDALETLLERSSAPTLRRLVTLVRQNDELGIPIAAALGTIADDVRAEANLTFRQRAEAAGVRASMVLVLLALPAAMVMGFSVFLADVIQTVQGVGR